MSRLKLKRKIMKYLLLAAAAAIAAFLIYKISNLLKSLREAGKNG